MNTTHTNKLPGPYSGTSQPAQFPTPMIRLRLPSEKPIREDGDKDGHIFALYKGHPDVTLAVTYKWDRKFDGDELAWFSFHDGLLPREPTQEEKWQQEFSEWWTKTGHTDHNGLIADAAWQGFFAAKKGGAK